MLNNYWQSKYAVVSWAPRKAGRKEFGHPGRKVVNGTQRKNIKAGQRVLIVLKQDQRTGRTTEGVVKDILTKAPVHTRGIKVRLEGGEVGRVREIPDGQG
jgi:uncharacterized repeat protein (TIGR03833 family)